MSFVRTLSVKFHSIPAESSAHIKRVSPLTNMPIILAQMIAMLGLMSAAAAVVPLWKHPALTFVARKAATIAIVKICILMPAEDGINMMKKIMFELVCECEIDDNDDDDNECGKRRRFQDSLYSTPAKCDQPRHHIHCLYIRELTFTRC